jgi:hypothetical protein
MKITNGPKISYKLDEISSPKDTLFENLPSIMSLPQAEHEFGFSVKTFRDWHYRPNRKRKNPPPKDLVAKVGGELRVVTSVMKRWIASLNPDCNIWRL